MGLGAGEWHEGGGCTGWGTRKWRVGRGRRRIGCLRGGVVGAAGVTHAKARRSTRRREGIRWGLWPMRRAVRDTVVIISSNFVRNQRG